MTTQAARCRQCDEVKAYKAGAWRGRYWYCASCLPAVVRVLGPPPEDEEDEEEEYDDALTEMIQRRTWDKPRNEQEVGAILTWSQMEMDDVLTELEDKTEDLREIVHGIDGMIGGGCERT